MIRFNCDYSEGAHPDILRALCESNLTQSENYGEDVYCDEARRLIAAECGASPGAIHFLVGGTQTNLTVIDSLLRTHEGVFTAVSGHINVHESGAVEACGHKVIPLASDDGLPTAEAVEAAYSAYINDPTREHMVKPKLVYISNPSELGTVYTKRSLGQLSEVCRRLGLYLYMDGARLGYGLMCRGNDLTLRDIARLCDVFYIGGTKVGALFGEAVVFGRAELGADFRCIMKQKGALLAKGRLLGIQFAELFRDGLYYRISANADACAELIRDALKQSGFRLLINSPTNQLFPVFDARTLAALERDYIFSPWCDAGEGLRCVRIATSWNTLSGTAERLARDILSLAP